MSPSVDAGAAVDADTLRWAMKKFAAAFPPSFPTEEKAEGIAVLWRELLDQHAWITREVFATAVYHIAWHHKDQYLPGPAVALDFLREAQRKAGEAHASVELDRLLQRQEGVKALAPPPSDPDFRSTPEERERWAREDAFIRGYLPGVLRRWEEGRYLDERTAPEDLARLTESYERDLRLSKVPELSPEQRRARDRRLEREKEEARAFLARKFGPRRADALLRRALNPEDRPSQGRE